MYSEKEMFDIARIQSAIDLNCSPDDFKAKEPKVVISSSNEKAMKYLSLPHMCSIVSYGGNAVASVLEERFVEPIQGFLNKNNVSHLFETPTLYQLNELFRGEEAKVCFMAEYFLPAGLSAEPPLSFQTEWLGPNDFKKLYLPEWSNALCEKRKEADVFGIGAFDCGKMIAMAACSADGEEMWQIGIDVLPEYRGIGLSTALTIRLKNEILRRGKVPFYCAAWCNIRSVRNAISSGFKPAWVEVAVKSNSFIRNMMED